MKRKAAWGLLLAAGLLAVLAGGLFSAWPRGGERAPLVYSQTRDLLQASLVYDAGTRTLRGTQTLTAKNRTGDALHEAVLRLYMNGQQEDSVVVTHVTANGQSVSFEKDESDPTVLRIALDWPAGETVELSWTLMLTHPRAEGAAVITLPALAMYENGAWRTDAYDVLAGQSYAQAFDADVTVDGESVCRLEGVRDASFALGGSVRSMERQGVALRIVGGSAAQARAAAARADEALKELKALGFAYPFPVLTVALAQDVPANGTALSGLIAVCPQQDTQALRSQMIRLMAMQTFGILVESDPWNAPWLSYSLSAAAELLCYRERKGVAAYENRLYEEIEPAQRVTRPYGVCVGAGTAFFGGENEMAQVLMDQGAAMLLGIERAEGENFLAALRLYVQRCKGETGTRAALEDALFEATGSDWSGYLEDELAF